jgi:hypothetical protein
MADVFAAKGLRSVSVNVSASGDNTLVAAPASPTEGIKYRVVSVVLCATGGANNISFKSGASTTKMAQVALAATTGQLVLPYNQHGWVETDPGQALVLNLSAATAVNGVVNYVVA